MSTKKGFVADIALFIVLIFVAALSVVTVWYMMDQIEDAISANDQIDAGAKAIFTDQEARFKDSWDYVFLTLFIGVVISMLGISYVLQSNPVMFFLVLIVVTILGAVAGYLGNAFTSSTSTGALSLTVQNFPITTFVMEYYLLMVAINTILMVIVFFAKPGGEV